MTLILLTMVKSKQILTAIISPFPSFIGSSKKKLKSLTSLYEVKSSKSNPHLF